VTGRSLIQRLGSRRPRRRRPCSADDAVQLEAVALLPARPPRSGLPRDGSPADCLELPARLLARSPDDAARSDAPARPAQPSSPVRRHTERVTDGRQRLACYDDPPIRADSSRPGGSPATRLLAATHDLRTHPLSALLDCPETAGRHVRFARPHRPGRSKPRPYQSVGAGLAPTRSVGAGLAPLNCTVQPPIFRLGTPGRRPMAASAPQRVGHGTSL